MTELIQKPPHQTLYLGPDDLYLELYEPKPGIPRQERSLLFIHGAYSGSWMWCKYLPFFLAEGYKCTLMNLRSHYLSRTLDMTCIRFEDYLEDIKRVIEYLQHSPILFGHSMGGLLALKIAEEQPIPALVLIDPSTNREIHNLLPFNTVPIGTQESVVPAPDALARTCEDESTDDARLQSRYLQMESALAMRAFSYSYGTDTGIAVDPDQIQGSICLVKAVGTTLDDRRGRLMADYLKGDYQSHLGRTHTGIMVGQGLENVIDPILLWLKNHH